MCVFIYFPQRNIPGIGSFKKRDSSGGGIRTKNLSIMSPEFYHWAIPFSENNKDLNSLKVAAIL
jgi:hypothetical protein